MFDRKRYQNPTRGFDLDQALIGAVLVFVVASLTGIEPSLAVAIGAIGAGMYCILSGLAPGIFGAATLNLAREESDERLKSIFDDVTAQVKVEIQQGFIGMEQYFTRMNELLDEKEKERAAGPDRDLRAV